MNIGIISLIPWNFLKQRPHMFAEELVKSGHSVYYVEPINPYDIRPQRLKRMGRLYIKPNIDEVHPSLHIIHGLMLPPVLKYRKYIEMNRIFSKIYSRIFRNLKLDFIIVLQPEFADAVLASGVPFAYDHVDDTQFMDGIWKERYVEKMNLLKKHGKFNIYIQEGEALKDTNGIFIPNCANPEEFYPIKTDKNFDAVVLSYIGKWFDMDSIIESKKKILLIGPMHRDKGDNYKRYKDAKRENIFWIPEVEKCVANTWINAAEVGLVPFKEDHPVIRYAMPIKILEYFLCDIPVVTYYNEGLDQFYGNMVTFYSRNGGKPDLDEAIDKAKENKKEYRLFAMRHQWKNVVRELEKRIMESVT